MLAVFGHERQLSVPGEDGFGRTVSTMEIERARSFVRAHHRAVLTTYYDDGRAQMSPVTVGVDAAGLIVISTRETAVKTRNLARDPRAVLCVFTNAFFGDWVLIEGRAEVVHLPDAMEPLVEYYRGISGEHPDWDDYRAAMVRDRRVLIRIAIARAGPDRHG
jgi:PPOX class probable F420-dependent enzyme